MNYYTRALQIFAIAIANERGDKETAEKMQKEMDVKVLEDFVKSEKENTRAELYYYGAGRVVEMMTISSSTIGLDATNDMIAFENLIFGKEVTSAVEEAPSDGEAELS